MKALFLTLLLLCSNAFAALTDVKFGRYQIADSQWNVSACLNTTTCQIYSKQPGVAYKIPWTNGQVVWAAGDYVKFDLSGNGSFPYTAKQYDSAGNVKSTLGNGKIVNMGPDYFFFVGSDNNTGQLFSGSLGMNDTSGVTWTGTLNPTIAQADAYADQNYSTTPLAAGQTAAPAGPTVVGGTITQTNAPSTQTIQSGASYTNNANRTSQQTRINTWTNTAAPYSNAVHVDQIGGDNNTVTISLNGTKNRVELTLDGAGTNTVNLTQVGSNYLDTSVTGYQNSLVTNQTNSIGTNYAETTISGNNNTANHTQSNSQLLFSTVSGNSNTLVTSQTGTGQHYLDVKMTGNGHNVNVNQFGSTANNARIDVTNAGGAATVDLDQGGGKNFTLIQSCANPAGCSTVVNQQ
jgi:hypothetical protein